MRRLAFVICLLCAWLLPSFASAQRIVAETFMIPATDPGIQLHVRNKHLEGRDTFPPERVVLFVHGATYPSETMFDINLPGGSWVENVARKGYDVLLCRHTRLWPLHAPRGDGCPASGESAFRYDRRRGQGCRLGGRVHTEAPQHSEAQPNRLVVGNGAHSWLHDG